MSLARILAAAAGSLAIAGQTLVAQDQSLYSTYEPSLVLSGGAQYLVMNRDSNLSTEAPVISGPDSSSVGFLNTDFSYKSSFRAFLAAETSGVRIEGIFSNYGTWHALHQGSLTGGLAFDDGITGPWTGANSLTRSTFFSPLAVAATPAFGGETNEQEGLGPNGAFPADTLPTFNSWYKSQLQTIELNLMTADHESTLQYGIGYSNLQLDEAAGVQILGVFRANDVAAPNGGLSHASLLGAGLAFSGGTPNGFEDETGNLSGLPDTLTMFREARTSNNLHGVQAVLQQEVLYYRGIVVNGVVKAGVYHNSARASIAERYTGADPGPGGDTSRYGRQFSDSANSVAFVGGVGLQSIVPLSNHWSLVAGYEATFIHGVALAPDQNLTGNGTTYSIDTHGNVLVHGANTGLQFAY